MVASFADMTDELGFGLDLRRQGNMDILHEKKTFRCVIILSGVIDLSEFLPKIKRRLQGDA